jgi:hypothetical protein
MAGEGLETPFEQHERGAALCRWQGEPPLHVLMAIRFTAVVNAC